MISPVDRQPGVARERFVHHELVLLAGLIVITVAAFVLTRAAAAAMREQNRADAASSFQHGEAEQQAGRLEPAIVALRRAALMDPARLEYQVTLARSLAASGDRDRARQRLLELHGRIPDNATVSLELARLSAADNELPAAVQYYSDALSGLWPAAQADTRRHVRLELIDLLLDHGQRSHALSEILVLAASLPDEAEDHVRVGRLFLRAGDSRRAGEQFGAALERAPKLPDAIAGAAEAAFENGNYAAALRWLDVSANLNARQDEIRTIARLVLTGDPLIARLALAERHRRLAALVKQAIRRAHACPTSPAPAAGDALRADVDALQTALESTPTRISREDIDAGFELAFRLELAVDDSCAPAAPLDRALLLIGRRHGLAPS